MTTVLVTRPRDDAQPLVDELTGLGFSVIEDPLMDIHYFDGINLSLKDVQGLVFTSANGVRAFANLISTRTLRCYCVGDATARLTKSLGFTDVVSASGDVDKLADLIDESCDSGAGKLLHPAASKLAGDLAGYLSAKGFKYERAILYEARYTDSLTSTTIQAIMAGTRICVLLFSPRTARGFIELLEKANLQGDCQNLSLFCLSSNVEEEIKDFGWAQVLKAVEPTQNALVKLLKEKMG